MTPEYASEMGSQTSSFDLAAKKILTGYTPPRIPIYERRKA
jgi:hypothetical protein